MPNHCTTKTAKNATVYRIFNLLKCLWLRLPPSTADIYDQPTSISWLYRAVGGLHLAVGLSLLQARRSGTHYRPSFVVCLSVLMTLDAPLRQYYLCDISALSATEMHCIRLRYINFVFYSLFYSYEITWWWMSAAVNDPNACQTISPSASSS